MSELNLIPITEANINMNEVAERLFLGPQGVLVEKIEQFNSRYGHWTNGDIIRITKGFKFKPGTYDRIKEAHGKYVLRYHQKPSSIWSLEDRIRRFNYLNRHFWGDAKSIQQAMQQLTYHNITWQENTEIVERFWNEFIERLQTELVEVAERFPNSEVHIGIDDDVLQNPDNWKSMKIYVDVLVKEINMKVYYLNEIISEYEWGDLIARWQIPIWTFLNNWCEGGSNRETGTFAANPITRIFPKYIELSHPYISRHRSYSYSISDWIGSSCTGDHQTDIAKSVWSLSLMPLVVNVRNWLSKYHIPNTNPLNRIQKCYYGMPLGSSQKLWQHKGDNSSPKREMSNCSWPGTYRHKLNIHTNNETGLICDLNDELSFNNPCDECEFRDGYTYEGIDDNIEISPCAYAIMDYIGPQTDEDAIREACIVHMMTCGVMRTFQTQMLNAGLTDFLLDETKRFPKDAELSNIFDVLGEDFHLEYYIESEYNNWNRQDYESLLDVVFNARIWHELLDELGYLHFGDDMNPEDMEELQNDWYSATLEEIRAEIYRIQNRHEIQQNEDALRDEQLLQAVENLTPEERTIRWATQRGSAINI